MQKELNRILDYYDIEFKDKNIVYYSNAYEYLMKFLKRKLNSSIFRDKNIEIVVNNLNRIMKYTNGKNIEYLNYIYEYPNFVNIFADSLKYYRYDYKIDALIIYVYDKIGDSLFNDYMIDKLLDLKVKNYDFILDRLSNDRRIYFINRSIEKKIPLYFMKFDLDKEEIDLIENNFSKIMLYTDDLIYLRSFTSKEENKKLINDYIDNNPDRLIETLLSKKIKFKVEDWIKDFIAFTIKEIANNENVKLSDIKFIGVGGYSSVYSLGDKVIKIGIQRISKVFKNNPYIVKPLLRKSIITNENEMFIEVSERVETGLKDVDLDDMYNLYKNIRKEGLIWTDVTISNIGRLIKDNKIYWNSKLDPTDESLYLKEKDNDKILKRGELVVLDADCIFSQDDKIITTSNESLRKSFEERYQNEIDEEIIMGGLNGKV